MKILQCILTTTFLLGSRALSAMEKPTPESIKLTITRSFELLGTMPDTHTSTTEGKKIALAERRAAMQRWNEMREDVYLHQTKTSTSTAVSAVLTNRVSQTVTLHKFDDDDDDDQDDDDDDTVFTAPYPGSRKNDEYNARVLDEIIANIRRQMAQTDKEKK
jgi:hypothetical protein